MEVQHVERSWGRRGPARGRGPRPARPGSSAGRVGVIDRRGWTGGGHRLPEPARFIEDALRDMCTYVEGLPLENFSAPTNNAKEGRRNAMCNQLNAAAKKVARGDYESAHDKLESMLQKYDDDPTPPDWMVHDGDAPTPKTLFRDDLELMIFLIGLEI